MKTHLIASTSVLSLLLFGCSGTSSEEKKEQEKPAEAVTGQSALFKMYQVARTWAPDAQVLRANSMIVNEMRDVPRGKAAAWEATFYSPALGQSRAYTFSVIEVLPALHKNVFAQQATAFSGQPSDAFPFIAVKVDTDKAYQTALGKAADYEKKNPKLPILLLLEKTSRHPNPAWRVVWGETVGTSGFSVYVDASTGEYLETLH
jgi:hypothetical protein